jgi:putative glutamine amidotransferase
MMFMMKRPVIGITVDTHAKPDQYESPCGYATSVEKAGGLPILLPYKTALDQIPQILELCDGIILAGGNDIDPGRYSDEPWHPKAKQIDPARTRFELALLAELERREKPVLGICLGSQMMNVHRGGSLYQYLPDVPRDNPVAHGKLEDGQFPRHPVRLTDHSALAALLGTDTILANSSHQQAIKTPGHGLHICATAPDGVIEAIEDPLQRFWLGVQWHPEKLHEEPEHLKLFQRLVVCAQA